jgi:hypothetical protein
VTLFATIAKLVVMHIFAAVAVDAVAANGGNGFAARCWCLVAGFTSHFAVTAIEFVSGLEVMIKLPE